jgi:hypothetical protein
MSALPALLAAQAAVRAAAGVRADAARCSPAPARPAPGGRRVQLRAGPNPFSTEPGAWSSAFEKRDDKPKKGAGGTATAPADKLAPGEVPDVPLTSEVRGQPRRTLRPRRALGRAHVGGAGAARASSPQMRAPRRRISAATQPCFVSPVFRLRPDAWPAAPPSVRSQCGADYTLLRDLLAAGEWEKADDETRLKMCELAGEEAFTREWVYFTEVKDIPAADLVTIDSLWKAYSGGRYGFSVQRSLYLAEKRKWGGFFKRIGWTQGDNGAYRKFPTEFLWQADAPKGHLPLTNCLRGTQLLAAVLEHPAFGGPLDVRGVRARSSGAGGSTLGAGGPPPFEELEPPARAALVAATLLLVLIGLANQG